MTKINQKERRKTRVRKNALGTEERPRLSVFRSNKLFYAQLINDKKGETMLGVSEKNLDGIKGTKTEKAKALGLILAKKAKEIKVSSVVFDRGSYLFHGRVKSFAEGAREGGLKF